jgi:hypothetical protein
MTAAKIDGLLVFMGEGTAEGGGVIPSAGLVWTREKVDVEERQWLAVGIEDVEHAHVRLVDRDVVPLLERDPIQLRGGEEDAVLQDVIDLEVRPDLAFIEIEFVLAHLLGVELPVVRLKGEAALLLVDQLLHPRRLGACFRGRRGDHVGHQLDGVPRRFRHLIVEVVVGVARVAEELGALRAELGQAGDDGLGVVVAAVIAAGDRGLVEPLALRRSPTAVERDHRYVQRLPSDGIARNVYHRDPRPLLLTHMVSLAVHRLVLAMGKPSERAGENRHQSRVTDRPPIGRRLFLAWISGLLLIPECHYGAALARSGRRCSGGLLIGLGFAAFWGSLILIFLSGFTWSWGWPL